jgi:hypothetical protein
MLAEKTRATVEIAAMLAKPGSSRRTAKAFAPWHRRAVTNAKRLRKK